MMMVVEGSGYRKWRAAYNTFNLSVLGWHLIKPKPRWAYRKPQTPKVMGRGRGWLWCPRREYFPRPQSVLFVRATWLLCMVGNASLIIEPPPSSREHETRSYLPPIIHLRQIFARCERATNDDINDPYLSVYACSRISPQGRFVLAGWWWVRQRRRVRMSICKCEKVGPIQRWTQYIRIRNRKMSANRKRVWWFDSMTF